MDAIVNGRIHTLADGALEYESSPAWGLLIDGQRIERVLWEPERVRGATEVIDLRGRTAVPGLIDAHVHMTPTGLAHFSIDLLDATSIAEVQAILHREAALRDEGVLFAQGIDETWLEEERLPTRHELDAVEVGRPVFLGHRTGHAFCANTAGLDLLALKPDTPGYGMVAGEPTGILSDRANTLASGRVRALYHGEVGYAVVFEAAAQEAIAAGLTTVHALEGHDEHEDPAVRALLDIQTDLPLSVVVYYQTPQAEAAAALGLPRIGGCMACWVDGDFGPRTAALLDPYTDAPAVTGTLYFSDEELLEFFSAAHARGLQIAVHCVGDGAVEQALRTYEQVLAEQPRPARPLASAADHQARLRADHRHRIEHAELITTDQLRRVREAGIHLSIQPAFNHLWPHDGGYPSLIGSDRAQRVDPIRSILEAGVPTAGGSDSTVTPLRPLLGIHSAVNHSNPRERISASDALRMFTLAGARIAFEEDEKGSLEPGKRADITILDADPLAVPPDEIKDVPVVMTVVGGQVVYTMPGLTL
jgi:predicted amidohydrolase YtcJ